MLPKIYGFLSTKLNHFLKLQITADETVPDAITGDSFEANNTDSIVAEGLYLLMDLLLLGSSTRLSCTTIFPMS